MTNAEPMKSPLLNFTLNESFKVKRTHKRVSKSNRLKEALVQSWGRREGRCACCLWNPHVFFSTFYKKVKCSVIINMDSHGRRIPGIWLYPQKHVFSQLWKLWVLGLKYIKSLVRDLFLSWRQQPSPWFLTWWQWEAGGSLCDRKKKTVGKKERTNTAFSIHVDTNFMRSGFISLAPWP